MMGNCGMVNTNVFDGGDSIGSWDRVGNSHWLGNSIGCWYIIWLRDVLGDNRGNVLGLVNRLGNSNIVGPLNNIQFRADLGDLGSVRDNRATESLDFEGLDILWSNLTSRDRCRDVQ